MFSVQYLSLHVKGSENGSGQYAPSVRRTARKKGEAGRMAESSVRCESERTSIKLPCDRHSLHSHKKPHLFPQRCGQTIGYEMHPLKARRGLLCVILRQVFWLGLQHNSRLPGAERSSDTVGTASPIHSYGIAQDSHLLPFSPRILTATRDT